MRIEETNYLGDQWVYDDNNNHIATINPPNYLGERPVTNSSGSLLGYINENTSLSDILRKAGYFSSSSSSDSSSSEGCYIATCVYGSYDCPEVWTLRYFRDKTLAKSCYGKVFIRVYYALSPHLVKMFGRKKWFVNTWRLVLDNIIDEIRKRRRKQYARNNKE